MTSFSPERSAPTTNPSGRYGLRPTTVRMRRSLEILTGAKRRFSSRASAGAPKGARGHGPRAKTLAPSADFKKLRLPTPRPDIHVGPPSAARGPNRRAPSINYSGGREQDGDGRAAPGATAPS